MILPDYKKLFEPYARDNGACIEDTYEWLIRESGAGEEICMQVLTSTMLELAQGRKFSTEVCEQCLCGTKASHADIEHYMLRKAKDLKKQENKKRYQSMQEILQKMILTHIQLDNAQFEAESREKWPFKKPRLLDFDKSWIVRFYRWL